MNFLDALLMLLRWKDQEWEVHPVDLVNEFNGWI